MSKSDLATEEQQTFRTSKDPSVIMTANGTAHTTEEAAVCVCDFDMFVQVRLLNESPAVVSQGKFCEANGHSYEWRPSKPFIPHQNGRKPNV